MRLKLKVSKVVGSVSLCVTPSQFDAKKYAENEAQLKGKSPFPIPYFEWATHPGTR